MLSSPRFRTGLTISEIAARLRLLKSTGRHLFWDDEVSLTDERLFRSTSIRGHRQVTDVYLAGLAHSKGGRLATLDRTIPVGAIVDSGSDLLQIIEPSAS